MRRYEYKPPISGGYQSNNRNPQRNYGDVTKKVSNPFFSCSSLGSKPVFSFDSSISKSFYSFNGQVLDTVEEVRQRDGYTALLPTRNEDKTLIFEDFVDFLPNMTPEEVLRTGSFGGTYFRPIKSSVTMLNYDKMWLEFPQDWFKGLNIKRLVSSSVYRNEVNKYKRKCGGDLEMWESSGWMHKQDPYGWFQWYCRFYLGRRTEDDERQVKRWRNCTGVKGRWKNNLISKIFRGGKEFDDFNVSPVVRQILQHWGYQLTQKDFDIGKKRVKVKE